jgi:hypothetical protein
LVQEQESGGEIRLGTTQHRLRTTQRLPSILLDAGHYHRAAVPLSHGYSAHSCGLVNRQSLLKSHQSRHPLGNAQYTPPLSSIFNERIVNVNVLSSFAARPYSVLLQQHGAEVILVDNGLLHSIAFCIQEIPCPQYLW